MKWRLLIRVLGLFFLFLILSCNENKKQDKQTSQEVIQEIKASKKFCFKNEYPYQNKPSVKDILELNIEIEDGNVSGIYNWLPVEKDQRKGKLKGTIKDQTIEAQYIFEQEGQQDTTTLKIYLETDKAIIKDDALELGLETTIEKIPCR